MSARKPETPESESDQEPAPGAETAPELTPEEADEVGGEEAGEEADEEAETAEVEVEAGEEADLEAEMAQLKDQLLRALAETENLRRRGQREREETARYAAAPLIRDLLSVADNLRRALDSLPPDAALGDESLKPLLDGVEMTERELQSIFERHDIVKLDPVGERLDPHRHEAMFEVPDPGQPAGTIVQVIQVGYMLHDRLLRPARVGVAKGGPPAKEPAPETEAAAGEEQETDPDNGTGNGTGNGTAAPGSRVDTSA
ncbi:MAG: nucleotide exchange factor GrpE [Kiloniellales bacterium]